LGMLPSSLQDRQPNRAKTPTGRLGILHFNLLLANPQPAGCGTCLAIGLSM
jgi:hypothetical protein